MPSRAFTIWQQERILRLDEIEAAHAAVGGVAPGRRYTTEQVNRAYVMTLAAQFQGFGRDLHSDAALFLADHVEPAPLKPVIAGAIQEGRKLDSGNVNPSNLADFSRLGMEFWVQVNALDRRNPRRQRRLEQLSVWRNHVAHEDELTEHEAQIVSGTSLTLRWAKRWRRARLGGRGTRLVSAGVSEGRPQPPATDQRLRRSAGRSLRSRVPPQQARSR